MATTREIRRLAFQALFQLDARGGSDVDSLREQMDAMIADIGAEFTTREKEKAFQLARGAYDERQGADRVMVELAPAWPVSRQAAVDRAILRLAHYEMTHANTPPKVAVNEAVELAKMFGTEKSPAFVNGLLDKVLKRVIGAAAGVQEGETAPEAGE